MEACWCSIQYSTRAAAAAATTTTTLFFPRLFILYLIRYSMYEYYCLLLLLWYRKLPLTAPTKHCNKHRKGKDTYDTSCQLPPQLLRYYRGASGYDGHFIFRAERIAMMMMVTTMECCEKSLLGSSSTKQPSSRENCPRFTATTTVLPPRQHMFC
jgi:hypothetical protein